MVITYFHYKTPNPWKHINCSMLIGLFQKELNVQFHQSKCYIFYRNSNISHYMLHLMRHANIMVKHDTIKDWTVKEETSRELSWGEATAKMMKMYKILWFRPIKRSYNTRSLQFSGFYLLKGSYDTRILQLQPAYSYQHNTLWVWVYIASLFNTHILFWIWFFDSNWFPFTTTTFLIR